MWLFLLAWVLISLNLALTKKLFRSWFAPVGVYATLWWAAVALYASGLVRFPPLHVRSIIALLLNYVSFFCGSLIPWLLFSTNRTNLIRLASCNDRRLDLNEASLERIALFLAVGGMLAQFVLLAKGVVRFAAGSLTAYLAAGSFVRAHFMWQATNMSTLDSVLINMSVLYLVAASLDAYLLTFCGRSGWRYYLPFGGAAISALTFYGRVSLIVTFSLYLFPYVLSKTLDRRHTSQMPRRAVIRVLVLFVVFVLGMSVIADIRGNGGTLLESRGLLGPYLAVKLPHNYIVNAGLFNYMYFVTPLGNFDDLLACQTQAFQYGRVTLFQVFRILHKVGLPFDFAGWQPPDPSAIIAPYGGYNGVTALAEPYRDLGMVGIALWSWTLGLITTHFYLKLRIRHSLLTVLAVSILYIQLVLSPLLNVLVWWQELLKAALVGALVGLWVGKRRAQPFSSRENGAGQKVLVVDSSSSDPRLDNP